MVTKIALDELPDNVVLEIDQLIIVNLNLREKPDPRVYTISNIAFVQNAVHNVSCFQQVPERRLAQ